jgi:hypothetical protein
MDLIYRGVLYKPCTTVSAEELKDIVGYSIFELKYRGCPYWVCRFRTRSGKTIEKRLIPADPSYSRLSFKIATLRNNSKPLA